MEVYNITIAITFTAAATLGIGVFLLKLFAKNISERLIEKEKAKFQEQLQKVIHDYNIELEARKKELDTSKQVYLRYSENQFELYNNIWKELVVLKHKGQNLWDEATSERLGQFAGQLHKTKIAVEKFALLIEENHYQQLQEVLKEFSEYKIGKEQIITFRNNKQLTDYERDTLVEYVINYNESHLKKYKNLLEKIRNDFKYQLAGKS